MKYLPTIDLWQSGLTAALYNGQLKLQRGQWVKCGNEKPSRFVRANKMSIWAVHPHAEQNLQFKNVCDALKGKKD